MQDSVNKDRDKYIGGSDIPIIMNLSPYKSRYDLLLEKAGYKEDTFKGNIYTEYGNKMESKIRDYINTEVLKPKSNPFIEGKHTREAQGDEIIGVRIHTDGERTTNLGEEILEVKTTSNLSYKLDDYKIYLVQLLFYMVNTGAPYGRLAVYERPEDLSEDLNEDRLQLWAIEANDYLELIEEIGNAVNLFIEDLKKVKANPFISEEELTPQEIPDLVNLIVSLSQNKDKIASEIDTYKRSLYKALESMLRKEIRTPSGDIVSIVGEDIVIYSQGIKY